MPKSMSDFTRSYLAEAVATLQQIDPDTIEAVVSIIEDVRSNRGRVFFLGVGGGAANASHAVNDFRKIAEIESYAPTDNVSELTARINDEGWESSYAGWLKVSRFNEKDAVMVFSVGGGSQEKLVSTTLVE